MLDFKEKETHPSYAMMQFSRVSSGKPQAMFGSSIKHANYIQLRIGPASVQRGLSTNWYFKDREFIEAEMSYTQFAEAITAMNVGSGVPVTLTYFNGEKIAECPYHSQIEKFQQEFAEKQDDAKDVINEGIRVARELLNTKKSFGKGDIEALLDILKKAKAEQDGNSTFIYNQFNEQMEKTVNEAKGEVEAFVQNKMNALALAALAAKEGVGEIQAPEVEL